MKKATQIRSVETLACDAGWRNYHFVKIMTEDGIVGWSEYDEGFGAPGVTDLDLFLYDPAGQLVGVDQERDNFPVVSYCVPANGTYRLRIVMYAGSGELGVQVFGRTASSSARPIARR